ncbi:MAG: hypothetical protein KKF54_07635 [Candidatus Omnitrophica bacterium]|nr:hypothetical protein [Candidatus Omnitrophota bacterium]
MWIILQWKGDNSIIAFDGMNKQKQHNYENGKEKLTKEELAKYRIGDAKPNPELEITVDVCWIV